MKILSTVSIAILLCISLRAQYLEMKVIPTPTQVSPWEGVFELKRSTRIFASNADLALANYLNEKLKEQHGFKLKIVAKMPPKQENLIVFWNDVKNPAPVNESYIVRVGGSNIGLIASTDRGRFYALQTFLQMLYGGKQGKLFLQMGIIEDNPRFPYRGMHLDVGRHFMPVSFVKKYIDLMSQYKFNYFHWHLTEDQGWRIEIKKYPKLTQIGSKRKETVKERNLSPYIGDGIPVEGFYTQEEIKDVVAYAKARYITVIPEIELPGHSSAALAAYPELGCKENYEYKVQTTWGIFKEVFCPTEKTFQFLEDVLSETIALFPDSPYIHIGGDEVLKDHWKESAFVQNLKAKENLKDEHEVQSYFIRRIEKFINSKGKRIIGWDEILEGGLAPNAVVMSWRGTKGGIEAARAKHDVIMTPTSHVYFDYGQGDPAYEPLNIGSYIPLEKVYSFEPVPKELTADEAKFIIGGQANVWTEYIKTPSHVEYMAFPRMLALSEVLWSRAEDRNFADFQKRLAAHLPRLDKQNVNYRIPEPAGLKNIILDGEGKARIELVPTAGTRILYTTDGSTPNEKSRLYEKPIEIELKQGETAELKTVVVNSAGRKSAVYAATIVRRQMLEPAALAEKKPGVNYSLAGSNADLENVSVSGETKSILLTQFAKVIDLKKPFTATFDGFFTAPNDGIYELQIDSTWDASVEFAGEKIIDFTGTKDRTIRSAILPLKAGLHKITLRYNHRGGDLNFRFRWGIKGQGLQQAYGSEFVH